MKCNRCDYTADDLSDHAHETGHLLCIVCHHQSLTEHPRQTCPACIGRVRADLADIAQGYAMLEPAGLVAMTLLGDGTMQRRAHDYELRSLALGRPIRDEWPADPLPVVAALASWEDFWRADFHDPPGGLATLTSVVGYLTRNLDTGHRAAQTHPAFDEFAREVQHLRTTVQHGAGLADVPLEADADCFDCGGPLLRTFRPPAEPTTARRRRARLAIERLVRPVREQREAERSYGIHNLTPWPSETARDLWRALAAGQAGEGLTNDWTCAWCRRLYDQPSYFLALRAASSSWVPVPLAAETARLSVRTVRSWANRLQVGSACRLTDRAVVVWWPDVSDRAFRHADDTASQCSA